MKIGEGARFTGYEATIFSLAMQFYDYPDTQRIVSELPEGKAKKFIVKMLRKKMKTKGA